MKLSVIKKLKIHTFDTFLAQASVKIISFRLYLIPFFLLYQSLYLPKLRNVSYKTPQKYFSRNKIMRQITTTTNYISQNLFRSFIFTLFHHLYLF